MNYNITLSNEQKILDTGAYFFLENRFWTPNLDLFHEGCTMGIQTTDSMFLASIGKYNVQEYFMKYV